MLGGDEGNAKQRSSAAKYDPLAVTSPMLSNLQKKAAAFIQANGQRCILTPNGGSSAASSNNLIDKKETQLSDSAKKIAIATALLMAKDPATMRRASPMVSIHKKPVITAEMAMQEKPSEVRQLFPTSSFLETSLKNLFIPSESPMPSKSLLSATKHGAFLSTAFNTSALHKGGVTPISFDKKIGTFGLRDTTPSPNAIRSFMLSHQSQQLTSFKHGTTAAPQVHQSFENDGGVSLCLGHNFGASDLKMPLHFSQLHHHQITPRKIDTFNVGHNHMESA